MHDLDTVKFELFCYEPSSPKKSSSWDIWSLIFSEGFIHTPSVYVEIQSLIHKLLFVSSIEMKIITELAIITEKRENGENNKQKNPIFFLLIFDTIYFPVG